jgi:hypothetical protein
MRKMFTPEVVEKHFQNHVAASKQVMKRRTAEVRAVLGPISMTPPAPTAEEKKLMDKLKKMQQVQPARKPAAMTPAPKKT